VEDRAADEVRVRRHGLDSCAKRGWWERGCVRVGDAEILAAWTSNGHRRSQAIRWSDPEKDGCYAW
jgi:hypothetical protein